MFSNGLRKPKLVMWGVCSYKLMWMVVFFFFFQAEDGIRDAQESRGLGDVYKRQIAPSPALINCILGNA